MLQGSDMATALRNRIDYLNNREMSDTANLCADAAREIDRLVSVIRSRDRHITELQSQLPHSIEARDARE